MSSAQGEIISEVIQLKKLILLIPAANASSERAASAARRIETCLRSTASQQRLNHYMILHISKELTDSLSLLGCANEFILNEKLRKNFGKIFCKIIIRNSIAERRLMMSYLYLTLFSMGGTPYSFP